MECGYGCKRKALFPPRKGMTKWCCSHHPNKCPEIIRKSKEHHQLIPVNSYQICSFGCGRIAHFQNKDKTFWCCTENFNSCPAKKKRSGDNKKGKPGRKGPHKEETKLRIGLGNKGKIRSEKIKQHWSEVQKLTVKKIQIKYKLFCKVEELKEGINGKILVKCQYCNSWFEPTYIQLYERIRTIEKHSGFGAFLYCSDYCKSHCICFNLQSDPIVLTKYQLYSKKVWQQTNKSVKKYKNNILNIDLRGTTYHLDHKYSIYEGFKNNINEQIIGHWKNFEIIPRIDNIKKGKQCSMSLKKLLKEIKEETKHVV